MPSLSLWKYQIVSQNNHNLPIFAYAIAASRQHARDAFVDWLNSDRRFLEDEGAQEFPVSYPVYILGDVVAEQEPKTSLLSSGSHAPRLYLAHLAPAKPQADNQTLDYLVLTRTPELVDSYLSALNALPDGYRTESIRLFTNGYILYNKFDVRFSLRNMRPYLPPEMDERFRQVLDDQTRWGATGLRTRSVNSLERAGICTVGDFALAILAYGVVFQIDAHSTASFSFGQNHLMFGDRELTLVQIGTSSWLSLLNFLNTKGFPWIEFTRNASRFNGWVDRPSVDHLSVSPETEAAISSDLCDEETPDTEGRYALCYPRRSSARFLNMIAKGGSAEELPDETGTMPSAGDLAIFTVTTLVEISFPLVETKKVLTAPAGTRLVGHARSFDPLNRSVFLQPPTQPGQPIPLWSGKLEKVDAAQHFFVLLDANALQNRLVEEDYLKGACLLNSGDYQQAALFFERALSGAAFARVNPGEALYLDLLPYIDPLLQCYDKLGLIWKAVDLQFLLASIYSNASHAKSQLDPEQRAQYALLAGSLLVPIGKVYIDYGNHALAMDISRRLANIQKSAPRGCIEKIDFLLEAASLLVSASELKENRQEAHRMLLEAKSLLETNELSGPGAEEFFPETVQSVRKRIAGLEHDLNIKENACPERTVTVSVDGQLPDDVWEALRRLETALGSPLSVVAPLGPASLENANAGYRIRVSLPL